MATSDTTVTSSKSSSICFKQTVVLRKGKVLKAVKLLPQKVIVFEKLRFKPDRAIGYSFGSTFKAIQNDLVFIPSDDVNAELRKQSGKAGTDNRSLTDTHGDSQTLKREEIIQMKEAGASGEQIIKRLVENSSSFDGKTVYSQSKYLKKKQQKHCEHVQILRPTARLICKLYREREPGKICHMGADAVSQLLTMTNVRADANVAVFETCSGVVLGSVMERLAGAGAVVNLHVGETPPNLFAVQHFNFPDRYWDALHSLPLHKIAALSAAPHDPGAALGSIDDSATARKMSRLEAAEKSERSSVEQSPDQTAQSVSETKTAPSVSETKTAPSVSETKTAPSVSERKTAQSVSETKTAPSVSETKSPQDGSRKRPHDDDERSEAAPGDSETGRSEMSAEERLTVRLERKAKRLRHQTRAWELMASKRMDALIVACRMHPTPLVLQLMQFLAPSRPFAVYCEYREPLMELFVQLSVSGRAISLQLNDTFMRHYQVLPERTHPMVTMAGNRGFVLVGIKVEPNTKPSK